VGTNKKIIGGKKMKKSLASIFVTMILIILFSVTNAFAQESSYFALKGGIFSPNSEEKGLKDFDTGYNIEVAYGYKVNPNFAIEAGIGKYSSEYSESGYVEVDGWLYPGSITLTASAIPITLTLKGIAPLSYGKVELYGGGGIGYYLSTMEAKVTIGGYSESESWDASALGFHLVGGGDFYVSEKVALGLEVKWFQVKPEFDYDGYKEKTNLGGTIFNAFLKFRF
jgi:outer membrane protein W